MPSAGRSPARVVIPGEDPALVAGPAGHSELVICLRPVTPAGEAVVTLDGDLDLHAAERVRIALTAAARARGCRLVRVDLAKVRVVDSVGLGALVAGCHAAHAAGAGFVVVDPRPAVRRAFEVTDLVVTLGVAGSGGGTPVPNG
jgi:anti-anti-sigma factor